jgi:hypothetical protein
MESVNKDIEFSHDKGGYDNDNRIYLKRYFRKSHRKGD